MAAVVAVAATEPFGFTMFHAALAGALAMVATRCCTGAQARKALNARLIFTIAGSLALGAALAALDPKLLQAGSSEIRNWVVVGEMARDLDLEWVEYQPGYRSPALTGTGLAFAAWKTLF